MRSRSLPPVLKSNEPCWCGSGNKFKRCHKPSTERIRPGTLSPTRAVPPEITRPPYAETGEPVPWDEPLAKSAEIIERMRRTGQAAAEVLRIAGAAVASGVTTDELDELVHEETIRRDAYPSPLGYRGFPKSVCSSVNEVICHGIPDDRPLQDGDIVNLDVTIFREGVHGDTNITFPVGRVDPGSLHLIDVTWDCTMRGIEAVRPGARVNDIGRAIEEHAHANDFDVVKAFIGHGIGEQFHSALAIPHYYDPRADTVLEPGMTFTVEPMISAGTWRHQIWDDDWTAVTTDRSRVAQFEHTVLVTDSGVEILTQPGENYPAEPWRQAEPAAQEIR